MPPGESQQEPDTGQPDPSVFTSEAIERARKAERDYVNSQLEIVSERLDGIDRATKVFHEDLSAVPSDVDKQVGYLRELTFERITALTREGQLREAHRLELKSDAEKALLTAREADQKAVQAALAAAEKARDQQVIASQLATSKSEETAKDQQSQQGATFSLAIASLTTGLNDLKGMVGELRAEQRGSMQQVDESRQSSTTNRNVLQTAIMFVGLLVTIGAIIIANVLTQA